MKPKAALNLTLCLALAGGLSACGESQPGRASGGAATGAGTGALIGILGGPLGVVIGAAVGAGAGALTATNTTPKQVDLGNPLWQRAPGLRTSPSAPTLAPPEPLSSADTAAAVAGAPSPGATAMPESPVISSQPLQAVRPNQPIPLAPAAP